MKSHYETSAALLLLKCIILMAVDAVNPGCDCLVFSATYGKEYGVFSSQDYPKPYPSHVDCLLYTFVAHKDEIVEITFKDFDIYKSHLDCLKGDYLKVFLHLEKGEVNELSPWSRVLCGSLQDIPPVLYSSGPALILELHSQSNLNNATGFVGSFRFIDKRSFQTDGQRLTGTDCDYQLISNNLTRSRGRFFSPRYPSNYPQHIKCTYKLRARSRERVRVLFEEVMLEKGDVSCLNRADVIKVYDGRSNLAPTIAMLCNEVTEQEVLSTGSDMYIEFISNSDLPGQGFKALFQFQPVATLTTTSDRLHSIETEKSTLATGPVTHIKKMPDTGSPATTITNCDMVIYSDNSKNGTISSPGYPEPYPAHSYCRLDFQGRGKERVQIIFRDFDLFNPNDDAKECIDALLVYVQIDGRLERVDNHCGQTLPRPIMSNGPGLMLEFKGVYSSRNSRGYLAEYSFIENYGIHSGEQIANLPCAFTFNGTMQRSGVLYSPNFPGYYPRDTECHYFFQGINDDTIHIKFHHFDVEGVPPCEAISASDYVEFSNFMARDRRYERYCGQKEAFEIKSDRKFFRITFRSNDRLDGTGFNASYRFVRKMEQSVSSQPVAKANHSGVVHNSVFLILLLLLVVVKL
nr:PREDICTED: suppressor of lurcher protein 1 [Bemisia tabaci]XP_018907008.1 PREDICTED: suppressor of lurcher protein 1 [Bemisia tabaci]